MPDFQLDIMFNLFMKKLTSDVIVRLEVHTCIFIVITYYLWYERPSVVVIVIISVHTYAFHVIRDTH